MTTVATSFGRDLERFAAKTGQKLEAVHRGTVIELFSSIILGTPVGNPDLWQSPPPPGYVGGRARAAWQMTANSPAQGNPGRIDGSDGRGNEAVRAVISFPTRTEDVAYLTNNLPYIERLEYEGWSRQAPAGMVRVNVARVQQIVAREASLVKGR